jgi:hypothetical protein
VAYADPIYDILSSLTGIPVSKLKDQSYKNRVWDDSNPPPLPCLMGFSPRKMLQMIGTEFFRNNIHYNIWIEATYAKNKDCDIILIEDARFTNEYQTLDLNIELSRNDIEYACDHASAMPPEPEYIDKKIHLVEDINYCDIMEYIMTNYKENTL